MKTLAVALKVYAPRGYQVDPEKISKAYREWYAEQGKLGLQDEPLFEGMDVLINKLKTNENYLLGIAATNKSRIALNNGLKKHELTDLFDITLSTEEANPKPDPDMAQIAMKRFNISNKNTIMIGDTISDIGMGVSANINTIGVSWGYNNVELLKEAGASFIVNNAEELYARINEI